MMLAGFDKVKISKAFAGRRSWVSSDKQFVKKFRRSQSILTLVNIKNVIFSNLKLERKT
jgi:hypothetical protein